MSDSEVSPAVFDLACDMLAVRDGYGMEAITVTALLPDGHRLTLQWVGDLLTFELDSGELQVMSSVGVREVKEAIALRETQEHNQG